LGRGPTSGGAGKTWLGAVLEEHLFVAVFLLALVKGGRVVYWARPTRDMGRALGIYGRLFDEGLLRLWKAPRNAAVLAQYIELIREVAEEAGAEGGLRRVQRLWPRRGEGGGPVSQGGGVEGGREEGAGGGGGEDAASGGVEVFKLVDFWGNGAHC